MLVIAILLGVAALVLGALFWIFICAAVVMAVKKRPAKPALVRAGVCAGLWLVACVLGVVFSVHLVRSGALAEAATATVEGARAGWDKPLLERVNALKIEFEEIRRIKDPSELPNAGSERFDLNDSETQVFELTLIVDNPLDASKKIPYEKIMKQKFIYATDSKGVYMNAFYIDDSGLTGIPWLFKFLLPSYRNNQETKNIPSGRSRLRLRVDARSADDIKKVFVGDNSVDVPASGPEGKPLPAGKFSMEMPEA